MLKRILYILLLLPFASFAQNESIADTITIKSLNSESSRVVLYSAIGAKQKYVSYTDLKDGLFKLAIPKDSHKGMYRLVYDQKTMNYIDFLYLGSSFSVEFNPINTEASPIFINSEENSRYYKRLNRIGELQQKLDSMQVVCFQTQEPKILEEIEEAYMLQEKVVQEYITDFNQTEQNPIVRDLINANRRIQPKSPIRNPEEYLPYIKQHYFDTIDFSNENLIHSSVLIDKVMDYVFYLTVSRDPATQDKLYKEAVTDVLQKVDDQELKTGFTQSFIQSFLREENIGLTDFLFTNYYDKLSLEYQDVDFKNTVYQELKTAVGRSASDIVWTEEDKKVKLSELEGYDYYIIMFWSTTCPHCMKEIPKLHEYTQDNKKIKVIAVGMETEESKGTWKSETYYYPTFTHILGLGKWENPIARDYNVFSTPNYFILDADKTIIDKPYEMVDVKVFFNGLKVE